MRCHAMLCDEEHEGKHAMLCDAVHEAKHAMLCDAMRWYAMLCSA